MAPASREPDAAPPAQDDARLILWDTAPLGPLASVDFVLTDVDVGVSTVAQHPLRHWPRWITRGPGGTGFVEIAERLLQARGGASSA